jgi:siroheme synthase-like protein
MKKEEQRTAYYPVFLKLRGKRCAVIGGGQVALRKVRSLLEHGASVDVISPELCPELAELAAEGQVHIFKRSYEAGDLRDIFIAIAATDDGQVNHDLLREAGDQKVLVNVVDDAENCDFIVPSSLRRGDVTIAVSTSGRSPALARKIRTRLENEFGEEYATLALLLNEIRTRVRQQGTQISSDTWQEALDLERLTDLLRQGNHEKAKSVLLANLGVPED